MHLSVTFEVDICMVGDEYTIILTDFPLKVLNVIPDIHSFFSRWILLRQ